MRNSRAFIPLIGLLSIATTGCAWIRNNKVKKRTNPAYRVDAEKPKAVPRPLLVVEPVECDEVNDDVKRSARSRKRFKKKFFPELSDALGKSKASATATIAELVCEEFFFGKDYPGWDGTDGTREIAREVLEDRDEKSVVIPFYAMTNQCSERTETLRNRGGHVVGTVGTGEVTCAEKGNVYLMAALISHDGKLIWHSGLKTSAHVDPEPVVTDLVEGYPRKPKRRQKSNKTAKK